MEAKRITMEEEEGVPLHNHPLIPFTRFDSRGCDGCQQFGYTYGGYRCNEPGCDVVFHKECAKPLPEINHPSHPDHSLKLLAIDWTKSTRCTLCGEKFPVCYCCSICDFMLDLGCALRPVALVIPKNSYGHEHPLELFHEVCQSRTVQNQCEACYGSFVSWEHHYRCSRCVFVTHVKCVDVVTYTKVYHPSHPQHPLESLTSNNRYLPPAPNYADKKCLLCESEFGRQPSKRLHHCDVCNFSICRICMKYPPPVDVVSPTTHKHQLHLVPRRINFTCNACGTQGDRSPYFCLDCNFMIHRECIDLPRVININRHGHRISYTRRLGHGNWKCGVCRKEVDGFYGAYSCSKCDTFVAHSRCATRKDVWDMIELEGTPEEPEELAPFEVIDDNTIKHFSHDHNLRINKDGQILHENIVCEACIFQICSEPFYSCEQCDFILHERCAILPRKKRHVSHNQPFTLRTDSRHQVFWCALCGEPFTGFRYESGIMAIDVRCASLSDSLVHQSHPHPLYYSEDAKRCSVCWQGGARYKCDECNFTLNHNCAMKPEKVMRHRYDDHPLLLSYGKSSVDGDYWCEACETKVDLKSGFYTCNDCGVVLHISCVVGNFTYVKPGSTYVMSVVGSHVLDQVVANTSVTRLFCSTCNSRCMLPLVLKTSKDGVVEYLCMFVCKYH